MKYPRLVIEPLESRIAPATFFVGTATTGENSLAIHKDGDTLFVASQAETDAKTAAASTLAVLLSKGDSLVFDLDNDHQLDPTDLVALQVTGGQAMVFLTDGVGVTANAFDTNELTGIAFGNGFKASAGAIVNGSMAGALKADGTFDASGATLNLAPGTALKSFSSTEQINGHILAGGTISSVSLTDSAIVSVNGTISTGTAASGFTASFNGGGTAFTTAFTNPDGAAGPGISGITLNHGAGQIVAGAGGNSTTGATKTGSGGTISNVTILDSPTAVVIQAGEGGSVPNTAKPVAGGAGGSLININYHAHAGGGPAFSIKAGSGGGSILGNGGAGGAIDNLTLDVADQAIGITVSTGIGGGSTSANAGAGGSIQTANITYASLTGDLLIQAGSGGQATPTQFKGKGGAGGFLSKVTVSGGAAHDVVLRGGIGADGPESGGAGGAIKEANVTLSDAVSDLFLQGGGAGRGALSKGSGGQGGTIDKTTIQTAAVTGTLSVVGGGGGTSPTGKAGAGGSVTNLSLTTNGAVGTLLLAGGAGGALTAADGASHVAGPGGGLSKITFINKGGVTTGTLASGEGGNIQNGRGTAGSSGAVSNILIDNHATAGVFTIATGEAGAISGAGHGGNSGSISEVTIQDIAGDTSHFDIYAGVPIIHSLGNGKFSTTSMDGVGDGAKGGSIGAIKGVHLQAPDASVTLGKATPAGVGGTTADSVGGNGGDITKVNGVIGVLDVFAPGGGNGGGKGGNGGNISDFNLATDGAGHFIHILASGNAGPGVIFGRAGSVTKIKTTGDIGNMTGNFDPTSNAAGTMGGIFVGTSSTPALNGSIGDITATGIATMLAGRPAAGGLNAANAVSKIAKIVATAIGADVNNDHDFDFTNNGGTSDFEFGTDTPIDGIVIVRTGQATKLSVTPLKLIEV